MNAYVVIHFEDEKNQYSPPAAVVITIGDLLVFHAHDDNK